tara:strand:- start:268 stop:621 length:354 start_codon:yes stop_codon:yes gene_type:complete
MKKTSLNYTSLSNKELEFLKDSYVSEKINSMSESDLKKFVFDSISHQIKDTIGKEEEEEAWSEMKGFYDERFENIILGIQEKFKAFPNLSEEKVEDHEKRSKLLETNTIENEKEDMW